LVDVIWEGTERYKPADLPDINFQKAYRLVKAYAGEHKTIASISVFRLLEPPQDWIVSFQIKGDEGDFCNQWFYNVDTNAVAMEAHGIKCFFDMHE
jgi:hypothetical protein